MEQDYSVGTFGCIFARPSPSVKVDIENDAMEFTSLSMAMLALQLLSSHDVTCDMTVTLSHTTHAIHKRCLLFVLQTLMLYCCSFVCTHYMWDQISLES